MSSYFKYAHRYLAEADWRFNRRSQLQALVPVCWQRWSIALFEPRDTLGASPFG